MFVLSLKEIIMYNNGMSRKVVSASCMPRGPRPTGANDVPSLTQGDSHG